MLQQTTVAAVVPYYERFMKRFPSVKVLAEAPLEDVLEQWSGLGYYSRARNLHKAAGLFALQGFPRSYQQLEEFPGLGPYTARAVASIAFDEKVGVLDGNVIRILCRVYGLDLEWWKPAARKILQDYADGLAQVENPSDLNQAMMELGATVCTPQSPTCLLCPWNQFCLARENDQIELLPRKKPRRDFEIWHWRPIVVEVGGAFALIENDYAPFLKKHLLWPGSVERLTQTPSQFAFRGGVTHYDIFVSPQRISVGSSARQRAHSLPPPLKKASIQWVEGADLKKRIPSSLIRKVLDHS